MNPKNPQAAGEVDPQWIELREAAAKSGVFAMAVNPAVIVKICDAAIKAAAIASGGDAVAVDDANKWREWLQHALAKWPEAEVALIATASAMGPTAPITPDDIAWATAALAPAAQQEGAGSGPPPVFYTQAGGTHGEYPTPHVAPPADPPAAGEQAPFAIVSGEVFDGPQDLCLAYRELRQQLAAALAERDRAVDLLKRCGVALRIGECDMHYHLPSGHRVSLLGQIDEATKEPAK